MPLQDGQGDRVLRDIDSNEDFLMPISKVAKTGQTTPHTVRLLGKIGWQTLLILVDSRSSHGFISETVVVGLQSLVQIMPTITVKIATGGTLSCSSFIPACKWKSQGHEFETDLRVLSLGCYDMVVGMDWLQACGPIWVDWAAKQLQFTHKGEMILRTGVQNQLSYVQMISSAQLCLS